MKELIIIICILLLLFAPCELVASGESPIRYFLYTNLNSVGRPQELVISDPGTIESCTLDPSIPTRIIIHGYRNKVQEEVVTLIRDAYLRKGNLNVIVVDWSDMAFGDYWTAARNAIKVGENTALLIQLLMALRHISLDDVTIVGFSLGAHSAGHAGRSLHPLKVDSIVALDPPHLLFDFDSAVNIKDAEYVQVIHTESAFLGFKENLGHSDFYPNFGSSQPGCWMMDIVCSHFKAFYYFAESIANPNAFIGERCLNYKELEEESCTNNGKVIRYRMGGEPLEKAAKGVFFVQIMGGRTARK